MFAFPLHTIETAPESSRPSMEALRQAFSFLPNIAAAMATSPVLIGALVGLFGKVHGGSFSEAEIQTVLLTDAVTNRAEWPVALHSYLAIDNGITPQDVAAMREGELPSNPRLAALSNLARTLIETRGHASDAVKAEFLAQGFTAEHLLEIIAIIAASTITNYTATITQPPLEPIFAAQAWMAPPLS